MAGGISPAFAFVVCLAFFSNSLFYHCCTPLLSCLLKGRGYRICRDLALSLSCLVAGGVLHVSRVSAKKGEEGPVEYEKEQFSSLVCTLDYIALAHPSITYKVAIITLWLCRYYKNWHVMHDLRETMYILLSIRSTI